MGIGTQAITIDFLTEAIEFADIQPAFEKGTGVDAGRTMALDIEQVGAVRMLRALEEMVEANILECGG